MFVSVNTAMNINISFCTCARIAYYRIKFLEVEFCVESYVHL